MTTWPGATFFVDTPQTLTYHTRMNSCQQCGKPTRNIKFCSPRCNGRSHRRSRFVKRDANMLKMAQNGRTLQEIGTKYGVTRERVRQILERRFSTNTIPFHGERLMPVRLFVCNYCGKTKEAPRSFNPLPKFCDIECVTAYRNQVGVRDDVPRRKVPGRKNPVKKYKYKYLGMKNGKALYRQEHRVIMEQAIGRKLTRNEIVKHKDGNGLNNDINNLYVLNHSRASKEIVKKFFSNWNTKRKSAGVIYKKRKDLAK